ncbi:MAG TPA: hypothetical protein VJU86_09405 [Pyrinomonadaceae bacterium]|nr:hypothetical protein [Pyrinomonadaceae bacterium]
MKVIAQTVLLFLLVDLALAQSPFDAPAPGVIVLKNEWRKIVRNPGLDDDPMRATRDTSDFEQQKRDVARANRIRNDMGREPLPPPTQTSSGIRFGAPLITYLYEAKIRNTSDRVLRTVVWHYAFIDAEKKEEVSRTACTSRVNVKPGKTAELSGISKAPPIRVIDVSKTGKESKDAYLELVVITRLEYEDGSFWQRPLD